MPIQIHPYALPIIISALVTGSNAIFTWQQRQAKGAYPLFLLLLAITIWSAGYALSWLMTSFTAQLFWFSAMYLGTIFVPTLNLIVIIILTNREQWLTRQTIALLLFWPTISLIIVWTNHYHSLFFTNLSQKQAGTYFFLVWERGIWFWLTFIYSFLIFMIIVGLILEATIKSRHVYRKRNLFLILAILIPWIANLLTHFALHRTDNLDLTPIGLVFSGIVYGYVIYSYNLFDLNTIARQELFDHLTEALLVLDSQNRVVDINQTAQNLLNLSAKQLIGQSITQIMPVITPPDFSDQQVEFNDEVALINSRQETIWYEIRKLALQNRQKEQVGWVLIIRNITKRKQDQESLNQFTRQLEDQNVELDAFAHTVAHDLKSPIAGIIGLSELLLDDMEAMSPDDVYEIVIRIFHAGRKLDEIVEELMLLAGVRKQEIILAPVNMKFIIQNAIERLHPLIDESQAQIKLLNEANWPLALGYGPWLEEVWANYLSNAVKYGGSPPLIEVEGSHFGDGQARFWVSDNGPGLGPELQSHLFTPFTRLNWLNSNGHGLGLSIVKRIVEKLGGQVGVESEVGRGTLFFFTLPVAK